MINSADIQVCYNNLYKNVRNYIWGIGTVEKLADLEVAAYERCPDVPKVRTKLNLLDQDIREVYNDDPDLKKSVEAFREVLDESSECYAKLRDVSTEVSK